MDQTIHLTCDECGQLFEVDYTVAQTEWAWQEEAEAAGNYHSLCCFECLGGDPHDTDL